jgi:integrase
VQKAADRVRKAAGIEGFVLHDLRRTAASYMTSMGISRLVVSKILNHVEQGVTRVYDRHSYDREKRQALEAWADRLTAMIREGGPFDDKAHESSATVV